jgi:sporulation protein YlmC with PRC-barrel domain
MKKTLLLCTVVAFALQTSVAREHHQDQSEHKDKSIRLSELMDADLKTQDGDNLGNLQDVLINPESGTIDFAVVGRGGFLGIGERHVPVPWKSVKMESQDEFTVKVSSEQLKNAPTLDRNYSNLEDPQFTSRINQYFQAQGAVGGAEQMEDQPATGTGYSPTETQPRTPDTQQPGTTAPRHGTPGTHDTHSTPGTGQGTQGGSLNQ